jgi:hypothetical protein
VRSYAKRFLDRESAITKATSSIKAASKIGVYQHFRELKEAASLLLPSSFVRSKPWLTPRHSTFRLTTEWTVFYDAKFKPSRSVAESVDTFRIKGGKRKSVASFNSPKYW